MDAPVVAAVITAAVALLVGVGTVWQKWRSDRRDAWWKRAQWAIDKSLSRRPKVQSIGLLSMEIFSRDRAVTDLDVRVLKLAVQRAKAELEVAAQRAGADLAEATREMVEGEGGRSRAAYLSPEDRAAAARERAEAVEEAERAAARALDAINDRLGEASDA